MKVHKVYKLLSVGKIISSRRPGVLAGWKPGKIFGRLDCKSGIKMDPENRVFFHSLEAAVREGYRPCLKCRPINEDDFKQIQHLIPHKTLDEFYHRDNPPK